MSDAAGRQGTGLGREYVESEIPRQLITIGCLPLLGRRARASLGWRAVGRRPAKKGKGCFDLAMVCTQMGAALNGK
jgi:hypothetical protein